MTVYAPFKDQTSAASYFATLDSLATLIGDNTPLYQSIDAIRQQLVGDLTVPSAIAKDIVVFTDGADTSCAGAADCSAKRRATALAASESGVRIFTIGLSANVDTLALGELGDQTGGAFLFADTVEQLLPLYGTVGELLSRSLPTYRLRWTVRSEAARAFQPGDVLLGRVQVKTGSSTFDVPFIVSIR